MPQQINYQGRVVVGTTNFDGSGQFRFALVNAAGTTTYWSNDGTSLNGSQPTAAVTLPVTKGLYSVLLGDSSITNMTALPGTVFTNSDVRLRVWFNDGTNGSQLLSPDQRIAAVGYAFMADNIKDGAVTSAKLSAAAVQAANIATGAVGTTQLASGLTLAGTTNGTFSGPLAGNASSATSAGNFTGSLAGDVTGTQSATSIAAATVTGKALTGFSSASGTITAADTVLSAINKFDGNIALRAPIASPSFTGAVNIPATTSSSVGVIQMAGTPILSAKGTQNLFLGNGAGNFTLTGTQNTATGASSLVSNTTGTGNTAAGVSSLAGNMTGFNNTATGSNALLSNTTASNNVATGESALRTNSIGANNVATGTSSLRNNTGSFNTAIGTSALTNSTSGSTNIALGNNAGQNVTTGSNNIDIASDGAAESNTIRIGTAGNQTATFISGISGVTVSGGAGVFILPNGLLGTVTSSRRFKTDIKPMEDASSVLLSLKPVTFHYKPELDAKGIPQFGLIAEEVAEVCPDLVIRDEKGEIQTVRYEQVNAMLLNEFLKEHRRIGELRQAQESQLAALRDENATLREENVANAKRLATLEARDKEREARLTRIEISLPPAQPVANTIASSKGGEQ